MRCCVPLAEIMKRSTLTSQVRENKMPKEKTRKRIEGCTNWEVTQKRWFKVSLLIWYSGHSHFCSNKQIKSFTKSKFFTFATIPTTLVSLKCNNTRQLLSVAKKLAHYLEWIYKEDEDTVPLLLQTLIELRECRAVKPAIFKHSYMISKRKLALHCLGRCTTGMDLTLKLICCYRFL